MTDDVRRILITAKTYPSPSRTYDETVCTAGIDLANGRFVRLYPVRFRHLDYEKAFSKYDILEMRLSRKMGDARQDTYTPIVDSIKRVGEIPTTSTKRKRDWAARNRLVLPLVTSLEELILAAQSKERSLGVVPMLGDVEFTAEPDKPDWTPEQTAILKRDPLFGPRLKPLEKIPWKFYYSFNCGGSSCKGHKLQVLDWEAYALYRGQRDKYDAEKAIRAVLHKYNVANGPGRCALHLFVGTHFRWQHEFMGIGVYFPPKPLVLAGPPR